VGEAPTGVGTHPTGPADVPTGADDAPTGVGELSGIGVSPTAVLPIVAADHARRGASSGTRSPAQRRRTRGVLAVAASGALVLGLTGAVYASLASSDGDQRSGVAVRLDGPAQDTPVLGSLFPAEGLDLEEGPQETEEPADLDPIEPTDPVTPRTPVAPAAPAKTSPAAKAAPGAPAREKAKAKAKGKDSTKKDKPAKAKSKPKGNGSGKNG